MGTEGERPRSSWQSWVRSSQRGRAEAAAGTGTTEPATPVTDDDDWSIPEEGFAPDAPAVGDEGVVPTPAELDDDLDFDLDRDLAVAAGSEPAVAGVEADAAPVVEREPEPAAPAVEALEAVGTDVDDEGEYDEGEYDEGEYADADADADADDAEGDDLPGEATAAVDAEELSEDDDELEEALEELEELEELDAEEIDLDVDDLDADDLDGDLDDGELDADADDDDGEAYGELLPTVPLLPSIAGRVEALSGVLRTIAHRVDGLNATTDVYRTTMVDRIDQFTETVLEQGRHAEQSLDEYRRSTERTIAELRRRLGEQTDVANRLLGRVEEVATDVATLVNDPPAGGPAPAFDAGVIDSLGDTLAAVVDQQAHFEQLLDAAATANAENARAVRDVQSMVEVIVDTMPASAEGSGVDLSGAIAELRAAVVELAARPAPEPIVLPAPTPAPAPAAAAAPAVLGDDVVAAIADAVVDRLDLDALGMLVAEHLAATFEVAEPTPVPTPAPAPAPARRRAPVKAAAAKKK